MKNTKGPFLRVVYNYLKINYPMLVRFAIDTNVRVSLMAEVKSAADSLSLLSKSVFPPLSS